MIYGEKESAWILEQLESQESKLSEWERNFVQSLQEQIGKGRKLSMKQRDVLGNIWDKLT